MRMSITKIYNLKYATVISHYEKAINQLVLEDGAVDESITHLLANRSSLPLDYDLTEDEVQLTQLYHKKDEIRSRKDSLEFAKASADSFLKRFCDFDDPSSVEIAIRRTALSICKYPRDNISGVFQPYSMILEVLEDDINRPYALFFKVKLYYIREIASRNYYIQEAAMGSETAEKNLGQYLSKLPSIDTLHEEKENKQDQYLASLQALMNDYDLVSQMKKMLSESACLQKRKSILERIIQLFETSEFLLVCSLLPTQIEGVFNDLLFDATTFSRFSDFTIFPKEVLKDKIKLLLAHTDSIYIEAAEYFKNYYNNMVRNPAAHGRYIGEGDPVSQEISAREQILDLGFLIYMLSRVSETDRMHRYIKGYIYRASLLNHNNHPCFGALFHDIIGQRIHSDYDTIEQYRPLQLVYWIVNPYYEKLYKSVDDEKDLIELRVEFLSPEFWNYVLLQLQEWRPVRIHKDFKTVVSSLFRCGISEETKDVLKKVNDEYRNNK